jgi:hypothetical protein
MLKIGGQSMKLNMFFVLLLISIIYYGCMSLPKTLGETKTYQPLDPLPIESTGLTNDKILSALPDETMRLAIGEVTANAGISYSTASIGYANHSYIIILDYIKYQTKSIDTVMINGEDNSNDKKTGNNKKLLPKTYYDENLKSYSVVDTNQKTSFVTPCYLGIGVRLTANIYINSGSIDLGNLFAIGAAAQVKTITGFLTIQTLGISGEKISPLIPMPSEINSSTIQAAILALGTIKSKIYDPEKVIITPRVVGFYNNISSDSNIINEFISIALKDKITLRTDNK